MSAIKFFDYLLQIIYRNEKLHTLLLWLGWCGNIPLRNIPALVVDSTEEKINNKQIQF